jgi:hypothetical protein
MKAMRLAGVLPLVLCASGAADAQNPPVAVRIVGSPAAQRPTSPPAAPPERPVTPPALPGPAASSRPPGPGGGGRKLELTFDRGTVALDAVNVSVRDVLNEWQRQSGCQFVNADKLPGSPLTLQFPAGTPQLMVLDSLLRGLGTANTGYGYIVGPRDVDGAAEAACGAVYILPTSRPTTSASYTPPPGAPVAAPIVSGSPDDEIPPVSFSPANPPQAPPQPRFAVPTIPPRVPPNVPPNMPNQNGQPSANTPPSSSGFGPVAPSAPGAGGGNAPPAPPPAANPTDGRGGANQ